MAGVLTIHYGLPGTGKSLFAVNDVIIPAVREHRPFFTNITGISLSGLYAVTDVHQSDIRYYPVKDIADVIRYFDDDKVCANGVFILDEMKDFIDDEKAVSWLESRINVMRKQCVDFVLIAQLPEKEYIHPHIIELADSCNVAVSRKKYGDTANVDWYYVDGGRPRIVNKIPKNSAGKKVRRKPVEVFSCYKTSENKFYNGDEDKTYRGLMWWQTRASKFRFIALALVIVVLIVLVFLGLQLKEMVFGSSLTKNTLPNETEVNNESGRNADGVSTGSSAESEKEVLRRQGANASPAVEQIFAGTQCYTWKLCNDAFCKTDVGVYPILPGDTSFVRLCSDGRCVEPCTDDKVFSSGR